MSNDVSFEELVIWAKNELAKIEKDKKLIKESEK